jgi:hypothetical protein
MATSSLPPLFAATREALHRVAEDVVSPARVAATGSEIALMVTPGGFGTPRFPDGGQVRVEGAELVRRDPAGREVREPLAVDAASATALAAFFAFAEGLLVTLRAEAEGASEIHLWPEHFDVAFDAAEVTYGGSPGDEHHPAPYFYVAPWTPPSGPLWNATGFAGAELTYPCDAAEALVFFRSRRDAYRRAS